MKRIVLTWCTHVGKTNLIKELVQKWYTTVESAAKKNMQLLIDMLWFEAYQKWRKENFLEFQKMIFFSSLHGYNDSLKLTNTQWNVVFYDRWVFDPFASLKREQIPIPKMLVQQAKKIHYDVIFLIERIPIPKMGVQIGRMLDEGIAIEQEKHIIDEYLARFGDLVRVPCVFYDDDLQRAFRERAAFMLDYLKEKDIIK